MGQRKILSILMVFLWMVAIGSVTLPISGCATLISGATPSPLTPAERALTLTYQYQAMEDTYKSHFTFASVEERQWMQENIAPALDKARVVISLYSKTVLAEAPDSDLYLDAVRFMREAALKSIEAGIE